MEQGRGRRKFVELEKEKGLKGEGNWVGEWMEWNTTEKRVDVNTYAWIGDISSLWSGGNEFVASSQNAFSGLDNTYVTK